MFGKRRRRRVGNRQHGRRQKSESRHRLTLESLEPRWALAATFAGNDGPPNLDFSSVPAQTLFAEQTFSIDLLGQGASVTDVDGSAQSTDDSIRFVLDPDIGTDTPVGARITAAGLFTWTPSLDQIGTHQITVIVIDEGTPALADAEVFTAVVVETSGNLPSTVDLNADDAGVDATTLIDRWDTPVGLGDLNVTIDDPDSATIASATISLDANPDGDDEVLAADATGTGLLAEYDPVTAVLSLSGTASLATYQQVLNSVTYDNVANDPTPAARTISIVVNDGTTPSHPASWTVELTSRMADFALVDVNPTSSTSNQPVSPRDYLQQVSAWYFGFAT